MELSYLVTIINRDKYEVMQDICKDAGITVNFGSLGRGTASSEHLSLYNLSPTQKAVVSAVVGPEAEKKIIRSAKEKLLIDIPGNGILATIPLKAVAGGQTLAYLTENNEAGKGKPSMEFKHELILIIMNEGYADVVMNTARAAGAGGGTIVHAKGTGAMGSEQFFGVSLANEKDILYIVAKTEEKAAIMKAVNEEVGPTTEAGAICISLPVSHVVGLRNID